MSSSTPSPATAPTGAVANDAGIEAMLRSSGLPVTARPGHEIYLCEPNPDHPSPVDTWDRWEILSATGRPWQENEE